MPDHVGRVHAALVRTDRQEGFADGQRAAQLKQELFPTGLDFLAFDLDSEWAESQKRLDIIDERRLAGAVDDLCGTHFLQHVRSAHVEYGRVLGKTEALPEETPAVALVEPLRALGLGIRDYATQVVAWSLHESGATGAAAAALRPIDRYRARRAAGAAGKAGAGPDATEPAEATPDTPMPEVA